jgi:hypothetical protein
MSVQRFNDYISKRTFEGYKIVDRNESSLTAVLEKSGTTDKKKFGFLDIILTFFTGGFWLIVWYFKKSGSTEPQRIRVSFDSSGNILEEKS